MSKYTLLIKLDDDVNNEIRTYYENYKPSHNDDSGFDLPACQDYIIDIDKFNDDGKSTPIKFGISCCMIDNNNQPVGYYLYPRSSFHKYPLIVANHLGIIDAGYRGNITGMVKPFNSKNNVEIEKNTKLFQICSRDLSPFDIMIIDKLPPSSRGNDGFGSTGK